MIRARNKSVTDDDVADSRFSTVLSRLISLSCILLAELVEYPCDQIDLEDFYYFLVSALRRYSTKQISEPFTPGQALLEHQISIIPLLPTTVQCS